jgi:hypothetical protein
MNYPNLLSGGSIKALRIMRKIHEMGETGLCDQGLEMVSHSFWCSIRHLHVVRIAIRVLFDV